MVRVAEKIEKCIQYEWIFLFLQCITCDIRYTICVRVLCMCEWKPIIGFVLLFSTLHHFSPYRNVGWKTCVNVSELHRALDIREMHNVFLNGKSKRERTSATWIVPRILLFEFCILSFLLFERIFRWSQQNRHNRCFITFRV